MCMISYNNNSSSLGTNNLHFNVGRTLNCYQCSASKTMQCSDAMIHMDGIEPESCDHVFDAQYCIKSTSLDGTSFWNDNLQI